MGQTKTEMANSVSNQQALVKRIQGNNMPKPTRTTIPGGKFLLDVVDQNKLESAVYTWLRRHRHFEYFKICLLLRPNYSELYKT